MRRTLILLLAVASLAAAQQIVQFKDHVIENNIPGGYAVTVADLNKDGKPDVIALSTQVPNLNWYENPSWTPHLMAKIVSDTGTEHEAAWERTGGGFSERFDVPPWQGVASAAAAQNGVAAGRGVPDVAAQELPGYSVFLDGVALAMGGTSAVAPVWASLTARVNQRLGVSCGLYSPLLYGARDEEHNEAVVLLGILH